MTVSDFRTDLYRAMKARVSTPVTVDYLPDSPSDVVSAFIYNHIPTGAGGSMRSVQVQCRAMKSADALSTANRLSYWLDSGLDEEQIDLNGRKAVCRPTRRPKFMGRDQKERPTYYFEVAIYGEDKE